MNDYPTIEVDGQVYGPAQIRLLREERDRMRETLTDIGQYKGEGGPGTPWREIVRDCGAKARAVLG